MSTINPTMRHTNHKSLNSQIQLLPTFNNQSNNTSQHIEHTLNQLLTPNQLMNLSQLLTHSQFPTLNQSPTSPIQTPPEETLLCQLRTPTKLLSRPHQRFTTLQIPTDGERDNVPTQDERLGIMNLTSACKQKYS